MTVEQDSKAQQYTNNCPDKKNDKNNFIDNY